MSATTADLPSVSPTRRYLLAVGSMLATLLFAIDMTIVNVALPHMQGSLSATQDQIAWVVTSYIVASAIATPLAGWLAARFGLRRLLTISVAGFTVASAACGLGTDLEQVVLFRVLQGFFGAALVPLSQVALLQEYPREQHGRVMGLWSLGVMVGPVLGPTLGGWLTDELTWRWAFFVNVPFGVLSYFALLRGMDKAHDATRSRPFDWIGFVLLSLTLALLQLLLDRGHTLDWFESDEIVAEAFFAALFAYAFLVHTLTARHPFVDPALFRHANFVAALVLMFVVGMSMLSPTVLGPSFLQTIQGYTAAEAGAISASRGLGAIVAVLIAGRLVDRVPARYLIAFGVLMAFGALIMFSGISVDSSREYIWLAGFFGGFGAPLVFVSLSVTAYATLQADQRAEAGVLLTLSRTIGSSIGISIAVSLLARWTQVNQSYLVEAFTAYSPDRWAALGFAPGADANTTLWTSEVARQAAAIAYSNDFHLLAFATLAVLPLAWIVRSR